jgi:hypothetical protein
MAIKSTAGRTRARARRSSADDQPPTVAERNRAIRKLRKLGGAHMVKPANRLIQDTPAGTIERCKCVIDWLAHIEQPFSGGDLDAAEAVVRNVGSLADVEVTTHA